MSRQRPRRGRVRSEPAHEVAAAWKRWLGAILFVLGGGGFAVWGVHDVAIWIHSLQSSAGTVETASALLGIAPLGFGIAAIGPLLLLPVENGWQQAVSKVTVIAALALCVAGILLATLGSLAVTAVMQHNGYRVCDVWHGTRMSVTTWAARGNTCPPA